MNRKVLIILKTLNVLILYALWLLIRTSWGQCQEMQDRRPVNSQYVKVQEQFFNSCVQKRAMKHQKYSNMVFWTLRSYSRRTNDLVVLKWHKKGTCYMHSLYQENLSHTFNLMWYISLLNSKEIIPKKFKTDTRYSKCNPSFA